MEQQTKIMHSEEDTEAFGRELAEAAKPGQVIGLVGDLGTGKTTLAGHIARGLGVTEHVTSPTFTIVREYKSGRLPFYHFDVYRVSDPDELFEIGYEEYFYGDGLCVVEWADLIEDLLPEDARIIRMEYGDAQGERRIQCGF